MRDLRVQEVAVLFQVTCRAVLQSRALDHIELFRDLLELLLTSAASRPFFPRLFVIACRGARSCGEAPAAAIH